MSAPVMMTKCPSDETLAAFKDGRLDEAQRREVMEHVASCADCYEIVIALWDYETKGRFASRPVMTYVAAALAVAAILAVVFLTVIPQRSGIRSIARASESIAQRPIESRLTGFPYKPAKRPMRGNEEKDDELPLQAAAYKVLGESRRPHDLGVAHLVLGEYDEAIAELQKAPQNAEVLNDLAAAHIARALKLDSADDARAALNAADGVLHIKAHYAPAMFNRALAMESVDRKKAVAAWQQYLEIDSTSGWANDARKHIEDLQDNSL